MRKIHAKTGKNNHKKYNCAVAAMAFEFVRKLFSAEQRNIKEFTNVSFTWNEQ